MKWVSDRALCQELVDNRNLIVILPSIQLLANSKRSNSLAFEVKIATSKVIFALTSQAMLELVNMKKRGKDAYKDVKTAVKTLEQEINEELTRISDKGSADYECYIVEPTEISAERAVSWAHNEWFTLCLWKLALPRLTSETNRTKREGSGLHGAVPQSEWAFLVTASVLRDYSPRVFIRMSRSNQDLIKTILDSDETALIALGILDARTAQWKRKGDLPEPINEVSGDSKVVVLDANQFPEFIEWERLMNIDLRPGMWHRPRGEGTSAKDVVKPNLVLFPAMQQIEVARKAVFGNDERRSSLAQWSDKEEDITDATSADAKQLVRDQGGPDFHNRSKFRRALNIREPWLKVSNGEKAWKFLNEFTDWGGQPGSADLMYTAYCHEIQEKVTNDNVLAQTADRHLKQFLTKQNIKTPKKTE